MKYKIKISKLNYYPFYIRKYLYKDLPHRDNGPALEWSNGEKLWYDMGICDLYKI